MLHKRITIPPLPAPTREPSDDDPGHTHFSHEGRRALTQDLAEEVNRWAFVAEKVLHGNPSGVDNAVSVFGGALAYTRPGFGRKSGMEPIHGFKSLRFLLTDTKVPRNTKQLVAGVALKKANVCLQSYCGGASLGSLIYFRNRSSLVKRSSQYRASVMKPAEHLRTLNCQEMACCPLSGYEIVKKT